MYTPSAPASYFLGLDLGQSQDYSALVIAEQIGQRPQASYHLRHLERLPLHTSYPSVAQRIYQLQQMPPLRGQSRVVVDATGVGAPVVDMLRQARLSPVAVTITAGTTVGREGYTSYFVPKRDLIGVLQILLQSGRLKIAQALPEAETLQAELLNFQMKVTLQGHDTYGAWREGTHDDLVLATAIAVWFGEYQAIPRVRSLL